MPPQIYRPRFAELGMTRGFLAEAMGYPEGAAPEYLEPIMDQIIEEAPRHLDLVCGWAEFGAGEISVGRDAFDAGGCHFRAGRIIGSGLKHAEALAFFVATVGPGLVPWRDAAFKEGDPVLGFAIDALGSETADRVAEYVDQRICGAMAERGWGATDRYSPGYCDWHVSEQHKLFSLLPEHFCGITLSESALMHPLKSVSGVIGLGPGAKKHGYTCQICQMENCFRRNARR